MKYCRRMVGRKESQPSIGVWAGCDVDGLHLRFRALPPPSSLTRLDVEVPECPWPHCWQHPSKNIKLDKMIIKMIDDQSDQ